VSREHLPLRDTRAQLANVNSYVSPYSGQSRVFLGTRLQPEKLSDHREVATRNNRGTLTHHRDTGYHVIAFWLVHAQGFIGGEGGTVLDFQLRAPIPAKEIDH
jgi:hypothetical protein